MNLIKLYIDEVESYLPKRVQEDVAKELLSNLEEDLEVRMASGDWSTPEEAEVALLQELGPPHELADSYLPGPRVLFGPALYPPFIRTMKIALSIFALFSRSRFAASAIFARRMTSASRSFASSLETGRRRIVPRPMVLSFSRTFSRSISAREIPYREAILSMLSPDFTVYR